MIEVDPYETALIFLTVIATTVMAVSAAIQAVRLKFDMFGGTVLAMVTAVGGGTLRDLLIGRIPVFWITDLTYLATAIPVGLVTFLLARRLRQGEGRRLRLLMYFDAIGLALFSITGVQVGLLYGAHPVIAVILGCITGVAGGIIRDVLCGLTPSVLKEDLYATISLGGGALYLGLRTVLPEDVAAATALVVMIAARFAVIFRNVARNGAEA